MRQYKSIELICGCDEAGRGALAGPVVASAVILPKKFPFDKINDSKKLSPKIREELSSIIKENSLYWSVGIVNSNEIDKMNILNASIKAMHLAIDQISKKMDTRTIGLLLIDGNKFKQYRNIKHKCVIKGDAKYMSIAAASILAKTHRDTIMRKLGLINSQYKWNHNKGYPTKEHRISIARFGITKYHRKTFKLLDSQYSLNF